MTRAVILVLVAAVAASSGLPAAAAGFTDDDGRPGERALEWLADRGVIHGCDPPENRSVCPDRALTRAEAAKILVGLAEYEGYLDEAPAVVGRFEDVDSIWGGAAAYYIDRLAAAGVVHGCDPPHNRRFCPQDTLRRGHIVKMVVRLFDLEAPDSYTSPWTDTA
ncbi:MAG TPA: S-layer homology domain-containing protein, partial [Acidimicrobiia bacterium]|nr:S-layer homology domain-containing protein [Acidimicrobiia bacterium]